MVEKKKNPYQLSKNQHIHAKAAMSRFANDDGKIEVVRLNIPEKVLLLEPNNKMFTVERKWDHHSESGWMKKIEDDFQKVVDKIIEDSCTLKLKTEEHNTLSSYFALWRFRGRVKYYADRFSLDINKNYYLPGISPSRLTDKQKDVLESRGCAYYIEEGTPARFGVGLQGRIQVDRILAKMEKAFKEPYRKKYSGYVPFPQDMYVQWKLLVSNGEAQFICADHYETEFLFPITPYMCLYTTDKMKILDENDVEKINMESKKQAREYFFRQPTMLL